MLLLDLLTEICHEIFRQFALDAAVRISFWGQQRSHLELVMPHYAELQACRSMRTDLLAALEHHCLSLCVVPFDVREAQDWQAKVLCQP
jgi:hypothetical protein